MDRRLGRSLDPVAPLIPQQDMRPSGDRRKRALELSDGVPAATGKHCATGRLLDHKGSVALDFSTLGKG